MAYFNETNKYFNGTNKFNKKTDGDYIIAKLSALTKASIKAEKDLISLKENTTNVQNTLSDMKNKYQEDSNTLS